MAVSLNKVLLAGNLTRDPEVKFLANERAVANFSLATNRRYKAGDGQMKEEVTFVDIEVWGRTAELVGQYLTKGRSCFVEGRLRLDSWEDKQSGNRRSKLKVQAESVQFLGAAGDQQSGNTAQAGAQFESESPGHVSSVPAVDDDEPPF